MLKIGGKGQECASRASAVITFVVDRGQPFPGVRGSVVARLLKRHPLALQSFPGNLFKIEIGNIIVIIIISIVVMDCWKMIAPPTNARTDRLDKNGPRQSRVQLT